MAKLTLLSPSSSMRTNKGKHDSTGGLYEGHTELLSFITDDRFQELDWNKDGEITFKEFLFAFVAWVGIEEDNDQSGTIQPSVADTIASAQSVTSGSSAEHAPHSSCIKPQGHSPQRRRSSGSNSGKKVTIASFTEDAK